MHPLKERAMAMGGLVLFGKKTIDTNRNTKKHTLLVDPQRWYRTEAPTGGLKLWGVWASWAAVLMQLVRHRNHRRAPISMGSPTCVC